MDEINITLYSEDIKVINNELPTDLKFSEFRHVICGHCDARLHTKNTRTSRERNGGHKDDCPMMVSLFAAFTKYMEEGGE
jgi:hypothetical protein